MCAAHPLDRPVWTTLTTRQAHLARGDARAWRLEADYGLFAAAADGSDESLAALAALVPAGGALATVGVAEPGPPIGLAAEPRLIWQMVCDRLTPAPDGPPAFEIVDLTDADAGQMLALATLTQPGPFFARTHRLGAFVGVKDAAGRLLAMAGERMNPPGFTEVSGVCTEPGQRGRGLAGALMRVVAERIAARGETAFLHSYAHNAQAIALYESLGFALRTELTMTVLTRP
ncbi:GNAT family N-acetyltransferase [Phenylobacterium sp.]|uniref:GNAT family N-acetyltransferase n=1 Tax=Phenylobacterium sp. TaxID=1871053 RepID=UPI002CB86B6C|nr:GNAT family N-acetyltransferase [Phenylobacterium sp.]HLZ74447.1 GNAT family N-acetyltransferase [Phenylobacterium sp.]